MVSRTTTANIMREGDKDRILDTFDGEFDLVEVLGHSVFPNSPCIPYQEQILSLTGITKGYTTVKEAKAQGLFHVNCIHSFGVTDKVMEIYRKGDWEGNEGAENKNESQEEMKEQEQSKEVQQEITAQSSNKEIKEILSKQDNSGIFNTIEKDLKPILQKETDITSELTTLNNYFDNTPAIKVNTEEELSIYNSNVRRYNALKQELGSLTKQKRNTTLQSLRFNEGGNIQIGSVSYSIKEVAEKLQNDLKGIINAKIIPNITLDIQYTASRRKYFSPLHNKLCLDKTTSHTTAIHETMHWLEHNNKKILEKSKAFLAYRTHGETAEKLSKITGDKRYKSYEIAKPDKFFNPYAGKIYDNATEVLSMGLEHLTKDPINFYKSDPEYVNFIIGVLRGYF